jgi:O-antigen ligase/polysaccharide polymerase Wzy-like membrane protein
VTAVRQMALWRELRSWTGALLLVALALALVRSDDQPGLGIGLGSTTATVVPGDVVLAALAVVSIVLLTRRRLNRVAYAVIATGALFGLILLATAVTNGAGPFVAGLKFLELAGLTLGTIAIVRNEDAIESIVDVLLLFTIAADAVGLVDFVRSGGGRQSSFLGEHDFAALATLPLLYGIVLVFERRRPGRAAIAIVAGGIGCILAAALASLLGFYLGAAIVVAVAAVQRRLSLVPLAVTVVTVAVVSACSLTIRAGDLGFIQQWFGKPPSRPGQYAASWSQRLIYVYVGGKIFAAHPLLGTGWYPDLPPKEFVAYLPAARHRFSDQPAHYFPQKDGTFIPQQTYDEVLYELGVVGGISFLALLVSIGRAAATSAGRLGRLGNLSPVWFAATLGALAGDGLFGGSPLGATFWLVAGLAAACTLMAVRERT